MTPGGQAERLWGWYRHARSFHKPIGWSWAYARERVRRETDGPEAALPQAAEPAAASREPWGWKVTLHLYGTGLPPGDEIFEASKQAAEILGANDFVGADRKIIQSKPHGQVAT